MAEYISGRAILAMEALCEFHGWDLSTALGSIEKITMVAEEVRSLASKHPEIRSMELSEIPSLIERAFPKIGVKCDC